MKKAFRIFVKILNYIGAAIALFILFIFALSCWQMIEKVDSKYIANVDFQAKAFRIDREFTEEEIRTAKFQFENLMVPYFMSNYHWLVAGEKTAIVFRRFRGGPIFAFDAEHTTQLTVVIPKLQEGIYPIDGKEIRGFYSSGGSAWPSSHCGLPIENGTLKISSIAEGRFTAQIDFDGFCRSKKPSHESPVRFHEIRTFSELSFTNATAWYGRKGRHIYQETYR